MSLVMRYSKVELFYTILYPTYMERRARPGDGILKHFEDVYQHDLLEWRDSSILNQ